MLLFSETAFFWVFEVYPKVKVRKHEEDDQTAFYVHDGSLEDFEYLHRHDLNSSGILLRVLFFSS